MKNKRYYTKLMLINTIILISVNIIYGALAFSGAFRAERNAFLQEYDNALRDISIYYETKHELFYRLMLPFYASIENTALLNDFLNDIDDVMITGNVIAGQNLVNLLRQVNSYDRDIIALLIYKAQNNSLYLYSIVNNTLSKVDLSYFGEPDFTSAARESFGAQPVHIPGVENIYTLYGISGNADFSPVQPGVNRSGIIMLYDTDALNRRLSNYNLHSDARFIMQTDNGHIIFDSKNEYNENNSSLYENAGTEDTGRFITSRRQSNWVTANYYLPMNIVNDHAFRLSMPLLITVIVFSSLALFIYLFSTHLSGKRVDRLEQGMKQIGLHNLRTGVDPGKNNDEFTRIAQIFNEICIKLQESIDNAYLMQLWQQKAVLNSLQTSINPHFLYNTMESVRSKLVESGNHDAADMIVIISRLFEYQIRGSRFVTVREEFENLKPYIELINLRFDYSFDISVIIDENIYNYGMPKFIIQPILENYFKHGMLNQDDYFININAYKKDEDIIIEIIDNGAGINNDSLENIRMNLKRETNFEMNGLGLPNVHKRLNIAFGEGYGLSIDSPGLYMGTTVTVRMKAVDLPELKEGGELND